jgi:hypothetical protein
MIKIIWLLRRKQGISFEEFREHFFGLNAP